MRRALEGEGRWAGRPATLLVSAMIVVLAWPFRVIARIGIDESWEAALHLAGPAGLQFGPDIVFTYGPLGFLSVPAPFYGVSSALATIAAAGVYLALTAMLLAIARRLLPLWAAGLVVLLVARLYGFLPPFEAIQAAVVVAGVELLARDDADDPVNRGRFARADVVVAACGALIGILAAGKLNVALFTGGMLLVVALAFGRPWWRGLAIFVIAGAITLVATWLVTGQSLANLPAFLFGGFEIGRGYNDAMVVDTHPTLRWYYAAFAAVIGSVAWIGWLALRDLSRRRLVAIAALGAIIAFAEWKTAFTRNYPWYAMITALIALFPLVSRLRGPDHGAVAGLAFAFCFIMSMATTQIDPVDVVDVRTSVRSAASMAAAMRPWRQAEAVERTRADLRELLGIPDDLLAKLQAQTVHVDPWQTVAMAAYPELRWAPEPIFQSYSAYTTALDEINADVLRGDTARTPTRILRERTDGVDGQPLAVDHRFVWFEQPAATLETICRYAELGADDRWQVLGRTNSACGSQEPLGSVTARAGESVAVPAAPNPGDIVIARITGFPSGVVERLKALLYRAGRYGDQSDASLTFDFFSLPFAAPGS